MDENEITLMAMETLQASPIEICAAASKWQWNLILVDEMEHNVKAYRYGSNDIAMILNVHGFAKIPMPSQEFLDNVDVIEMMDMDDN